MEFFTEEKTLNVHPQEAKLFQGTNYLVLYHLQTKSPGLARKGFFHWRNHVATFIDRNWEILFPSDIKKKKKWTGTIAGTLSHFSSYIFLSGTSTFNEPAWWTLMYPKLSPLVTSHLYTLMNLEKQKGKMKNEKISVPDAEMFQGILSTYIKDDDLIQSFNISNMHSADGKEDITLLTDFKKNTKQKAGSGNKRKINLPSIGNTSKKLMKLASSSATSSSTDELTTDFDITDFQEQSQSQNVVHKSEPEKRTNCVKLLDPYCHYNTSINNISRIKGQRMQFKLTGGIRKEQILSPYSALYLKPFIQRDTETTPLWLQLMAELQIVANRKNGNYELPPRAPIDYSYVQPEHIPAINSLCNQFFWPGIDLTETLQYPDFSCVVLYKRLIIGFAFLVPDVKHTENYISFVFTRPNWRNCGIATFMVYHLIQTSLGKDITLHVSINNPALFLYQKFGFKVENVELDFYDKYFRNDVNDSKHAFFCRLER
ncbi:cysteine-rich protein 2-binding protein isoform X2 [Anoplophora glabripennis]|uniref:cysteine-rich protein 2-binding protein isoform X2 n=1 Tax=Anoplophora glabripennis TaxID=217634 RepID=UPI0008738D14|nr:cysteine-rich protein 2-binding protein isoform X2 [Anoplophora glabripennis]